jgi:HSP20 family protein
VGQVIPGEEHVSIRWRYLEYQFVVSPAEPTPLELLVHGIPAGVRIAQPRWRPAADVYESPTTITITVEAAGLDPDAIEVLVFEDAVVISGERWLSPPDPEGHFHAAEIRQGPFRLEVALPAPVDPNRVDARYELGLLRLTLGKRARGGTR